MANPAARNGLTSMDQWQLMLEQARVLLKSGFLPDAIRTAEAAVAIILKGHELGVPTMHALSNIAVVNGKPTCSAELMLALIYRDHGDLAILFEETTPDRCTISYTRRAWPDRKTHSFTRADADRAQLTSGRNKDTWGKYGAQMLRARCASAVARMGFPDSIGGMYTPEEMGASVYADEATGEIRMGSTPDAPQLPSPAPAEVLEGEIVQEATPVGRKAAPTHNLAAEAPRMDPQIKAAMKRYADAATEAGHASKAAQRAYAEAHSGGRPLEALTVADWDVLAGSVMRDFVDGPTRSWEQPAPLPAMADSETGAAP